MTIKLISHDRVGTYNNKPIILVRVQAVCLGMVRGCRAFHNQGSS